MRKTNTYTSHKLTIFPYLISVMESLKKAARKKDMPFMLIAILLGFLNHFLYELSGCSAFAALCCPVNESVWEHLKLIFFPILIVSLLEYLIRRPDAVRFFYYRFLAVCCAMGVTLTLFYTYTGIIGRSFLIIDILIFLVSILTAFYMDAYFYKVKIRKTSQAATFSLWIITSLCYFAFTCFPPDIPLFFSMS